VHIAHHKPPVTLTLPQEADVLALGGALAPTLTPGLVVYLEGELGAGKTTLVRGTLRALGFRGRVKSPTFTLVEAYNFSRLDLYHFDFYRFEKPQNIAEAGFREYFGGNAVCLVEWPEKAAGLPPADLRIALGVTQGGRTVELHAETEAGTRCLERMHQTGMS
jgi:tRNA threonylcarbamoyladenosine biosynthesis protein TsaE